MSPSGVQKERMQPEDMYVLSPDGTIVSSPSQKPYPNKPPKCSDCAPLFMKIEAYPKATAVLVRNHGIYVWGDSWISAKTQAECYHYLFDAAIKLHQMGIDWSTPAHGFLKTSAGASRDLQCVVKSGKTGQGKEPRCIVLDIEGTTTPISFVTDVLFPYACDNVGRHLMATYDTTETQHDINLLRAQIEEDLSQGMPWAVPVPPDSEGKDMVVASLVANVAAMIKADRKITALKQLQVR